MIANHLSSGSLQDCEYKSALIKWEERENEKVQPSLLGERMREVKCDRQQKPANLRSNKDELSLDTSTACIRQWALTVAVDSFHSFTPTPPEFVIYNSRK